MRSMEHENKLNEMKLNGVGWSSSSPGHLYPPKDPVPILQQAGWAQRPVWIGAENVAPTRIQSPDRPACSKSLYQLHYPGPFVFFGSHYNSWMGSLKSRLQNVKSQYQYAYWKVLTPELLELRLFSSSPEISGFLESQLHVDGIVLYFFKLP